MYTTVIRGRKVMCTEKRYHPVDSFKARSLHTQRTWHFDGAPATLSQFGYSALTFEAVDQRLYIRYLVQAGIEIARLNVLLSTAVFTVHFSNPTALNLDAP